MKMCVALISTVLFASAAVAQHEHGASTGSGNENRAEARETGGGESNGATANRANRTEADATNGSEERRICRRLDTTGSRLAGERLCMTRQQWREYERNN